MMAVGLSSSILGCLVTLLVYSYCQRYQRQSHDTTVIHPVSAPLNISITNHINKLDEYDSVEAIKQRQSHNVTFIHPVSAPLNISITNHINKLDKYDSVEAIKDDPSMEEPSTTQPPAEAFSQLDMPPPYEAVPGEDDLKPPVLQRVCPG
ncbi:hypothetical protein NHX12_021043 [Muraenolepis orangiensis]|uniref:Uncharacterized protein n=1 Tax=Muraenolepis orangiensis TaxID=630683 RepID=A0A9Q0EUP7_9TELE|nr:hypothetical protein NHX12_021043 [Muraenolepis orangiensis]